MEKPPLTNAELDRLDGMVRNAITGRAEFFKKFFDPRRNIDDECGYPSSATALQVQEFQSLYDKEAIPARVVECLPRESWQVQPWVYEVGDPNEVTPFEQAWDVLGKALRGERSWYQDEAGSPIWEYLQRADELSGIGYFGVLLLGFDDGMPSGVPMGGAMSVNKARREVPAFTANFVGEARPTIEQLMGTGTGYGGPPVSHDSEVKYKLGTKLLFVRAFPESLVQIAQYETNTRSPRFGQPVRYQITLNDLQEAHGGVGLPTHTIFVHWSRVIHLADNRGYSEIFGTPRMRPVLNRLLDLRKLYGGSAEMYWRGAFPGMSIETHPQLGGDVQVDSAGLRDMMEQYSNGLQRYLALMGMSAKSLAPTVVDPTPQINTQLEAICIKLGIPKRVFMGSERGELASSQDDAAWNDRLRYRQNTYITPRIIVPFVDRLISVGVLPEPKGYSVEWPDLSSQTDSERASVAVQKTTALAQYVGGGVEALIPPMDYLTTVLEFTEEEAATILQNAAQVVERDVAPMPSEPDEEPEPVERPTELEMSEMLNAARVEYGLTDNEFRELQGDFDVPEGDGGGEEDEVEEDDSDGGDPDSGE